MVTEKEDGQYCRNAVLLLLLLNSGLTAILT